MNCVRSTWSSPVSCQESDVFNRLTSAILLFPPKVGLIPPHQQWLKPHRDSPPTLQPPLEIICVGIKSSEVLSSNHHTDSTSTTAPWSWLVSCGGRSRLSFQQLSFSLTQSHREALTPNLPGFSLLRSSVRSKLKGLVILDTLFKPGFSCWSSTSCWSLLLSVSAASSVLQLCS